VWQGTHWVNANRGYSFTDLLGNYYYFSGCQLDIHYKIMTNIEETNTDKLTFILNQNYPNPFNPVTKISYVIPNGAKGVTTLKVYNLLGKEVATLVNETKASGIYEVEFNAENLPSGIYFYKLTAGKFSETKKMMLLK
jgi:hypothetical protein